MVQNPIHTQVEEIGPVDSVAVAGFILTEERFRALLGTRGDCDVPIRPLLEGGAFGPDKVQTLVAAFEASLKELQLINRSDPVVLIVAKRIITAAQQGERDPVVLCARVVRSLKNDPTGNQ